MSEAEPAKVAAADQAEAAKADPKVRATRNSAPQPTINPPGPCESCREHQEATDARLEALDNRITSLAKITVTAILAGVVIYFLNGLESPRAKAAVED